MTKASSTRSFRGPTLAVVAKEAGVSKETVSHILGSKADRYHEETCRKVLAAAKKLNYRPHRAAQMMRGGRSNLIGIIHFGIANQNANKAAHYLPQIIQEAGYDVFVIDMSWQGGNRQKAIDLLVESRVEGVIITQQVESFGQAELSVMTRAGVPVVSLAGNETLGIPTVYGDSGVAICEIVHHLVEIGHRKLLLLTNDYKARPTRSRITGFRQGIDETGGRLVERVRELHQAEEGIVGVSVQLPPHPDVFDPGVEAYHFTRQLIAEELLPDAIVATSDRWAQGVIAAALEGGLRIPDDLAVTGFDNAPFGAHAPYYLTTAAPDVGAECAKVVEILLELIAQRPLPQQHYVFPCRMIVRRSCGAKSGQAAEAPEIRIPL